MEAKEERVSGDSAGIRRWRAGGGWSGTHPVRGCVSQQINQQSDGSAKRLCDRDKSKRLYCMPSNRADTHQGRMNANVWR